MFDPLFLGFNLNKIVLNFIGFSNIYHGPEHECVIEKLQPGHTYHVRVSCESSVGVGFWSATLTVTTQAIAPRDCQPARVSEAQPNCLHLQWGMYLEMCA